MGNPHMQRLLHSVDYLLAQRSDVVPDCTATLVPAIFRSSASEIIAEPVSTDYTLATCVVTTCEIDHNFSCIGLGHSGKDCVTHLSGVQIGDNWVPVRSYEH